MYGLSENTHDVQGNLCKEAKATPTVCMPNNSVNRRLPKLDRLNTGYAKCRKVKNSKESKPRKMTLNIR